MARDARLRLDSAPAAGDCSAAHIATGGKHMENTAEIRANPLGTAAMAVGIAALVLSLIPGIGIVSVLLGPVAIVLGILALNRKGLPAGRARAGLITGGIALLIAIIWLVYFGMRGAAERAADAGGIATNDYLMGRWSAVRGNCRPGFATEYKLDGSYTAPSTTPGRLAIGIWNIDNGTLSMGTIFREDHFRIRRVSGDELRLEPQATPPQPPLTLYRC